MSVISGKNGAVNGSSTVRTWSINSSADLQKFVASNTAGGAGRLDGNFDWSGSYAAYGHTPDVLPGEGFTFTGSLDGTNGVTGTAIVDTCEITIDIEAGGIIEHTVNFSSNGALTKGSAAATDVTVADPPSAIGCKIELGTVAASPVWSEVGDIRTITISLEADNQSYVSSSTASQTLRKAGNIDASISYTFYEGDPANFPAEGTVTAIRAYVTSVLFWEFKWMRFAEAGDIEGDIEGGGLVGASCNLNMAGVTNVAGTPTAGDIIKPDTNDFWP